MLALVGSFFLAVVLGIPISVSIGLSAVIYILFYSSVSLAVIAQQMALGIDSFPLLAVTLSVAGGIVGTTLGFLLAWLIASVSPLPAAVQLWSVALGIGITAVVGVVFGVYPAMRAARLDPIEALRRE